MATILTLALGIGANTTVFNRLEKAPPGARASLFARTSQLKSVPAAKGMSPLRDKYGEPIAIVFAVVAAVLLLACANVANLLLSRASVRQREIAVRKALGAGRIRLIRQVLTESLLLSVAAAAGALSALWTAPALIAMLAPSDTPVQLAVGLDIRVLAFTAAASLFTAIGCGILPALRTSEVDIHSALKGQTYSLTTPRAVKLRGTAAQIALANRLIAELDR